MKLCKEIIKTKFDIFDVDEKPCNTKLVKKMGGIIKKSDNWGIESRVEIFQCPQCKAISVE